MDSKSIIMIAYHFPPEGNAAVYRPLRFLKELMKMGWQATVISGEPYGYERYDPRLLAQVPSAARVVRVRGRDLWHAFQSLREVQLKNRLANSSAEEVRQVVTGHHAPWRARLRELVRKAEACVYRPDMSMPWIRPAIRETMAVCQQNYPNVIWATIGPLSSAVIAYRTAVVTGIPYVLDFRDPWGLEYYPHEVRRPDWARRQDNRLISQMFEKAQSVVFMFESVARSYLQAFPGALDRAKIHIIPNGFEGEVESFIQIPSERCVVLYAGTLKSYRYDTLLEGLFHLKQRDPKRASLLRLRFVGEGLRELVERVTARGLSDLVEVLPPTSSAEVLRLQREAHALLVLGRNLDKKGHELVAGAKLFGYLQAGRPIIGVVPHDETRRILAQVGSLLIADAEAPAEVCAILEKVLDAWLGKTLERLIPNRAACEAYSSKHQIVDLLAALSGTLPKKMVTAEGVSAVSSQLRTGGVQ